MGIREKLNQNAGLSMGVTIALIVIALVVIISQLRPRKPAGVTSKMWFTTDDGATWFKDDASKAPPWDKDGKQAVQAYVYKCPKGKAFVTYLRRYTPAALEMFQVDIKAGFAPRMSEEVVGYQNVEIKKPGDKEWKKMNEPREELRKVTTFTCPDGTTQGMEFVYP